MSALASFRFNGITKQETESRDKGGYQRRTVEKRYQRIENTGEYINTRVTVQEAVKEIIERQTGAAVA